MKKHLKVLQINLILFMIVLMLTEIVFGSWFGENYGTLVIPKDMDRRFDVSGLYQRNDPKIRYTRDGNGFRGDYQEPSEIDILAVGGSTTNEIIIDDRETWTYVLQSLFHKQDRSVYFVNGGVDCQSTVGHLANFDYWYPKISNFKPKYILFFIGINDTVITKTGYLSKQDRFFNYTSTIKQYLLNYSAIYTLFRNIRGTLRARKANLIHGARRFPGHNWQRGMTQPNVRKIEKEYEVQLIAYRKRIELLVARTKNLGATPILVTQHDATYRINGSEVYGRKLKNGDVDYGNYSILAAHNRSVMKVCKKIDAICIDLFAKLRFDDGDHYDTIHTTPSGSYKIGKFLLEQLHDRVRFRR